MSNYVLVIEDDPDVRENLVEALTDEGNVVRSAKNGLEGLEQVKADPPALILLDLYMPVMSGLEFLEAYRAVPERSPVVVLSAASDEVDGVDAILRKPLELSQLLAVVARHRRSS